LSAYDQIAASTATVLWLSRAQHGRESIYSPRDKEHLLVDREHLVRLRDDDLRQEYHGNLEVMAKKHLLLDSRSSYIQHLVCVVSS
jgi:hypothetical protein